MKLYFSPGACSFADHIALHEAGLSFEWIKVDLKTKRTEDGRDFTEINPKGYVPALMLEPGEILTENIAILMWVAERTPGLVPKEELGRYRLWEMLAYISTEIHKSFKPLFSPDADDKAKAQAKETILKRLSYIAERMKGDYVLGNQFTVADCYLFTMLTWCRKTAMILPAPLPAYAKRVAERESVKMALQHEGWELPRWA